MTGLIVNNSKNTGRQFKKKIFDFKTEEEYLRINLESKQFKGMKISHYSLLPDSLSYTRQYTKLVIQNLDFSSDNHKKLIEYLTILNNNWSKRTLNIQNISVPPRWREYVINEDKTINRTFFELYVISELANLLNSGEIWVKDSIKYSSLEDIILPKKHWEEIYPKIFKELNLPVDNLKFVSQTENKLIKSSNIFNKGIVRNRYISIKQGKLCITPFDKKEVPMSVSVFKKELLRRLGTVDLTDILIDVQNTLNYCEYFKHIGGRVKTNSKEIIQRIIATLHSYACNLGPNQTAKSTKIYSEKQIRQTRKFYLTQQNLRAVNNEIVNQYSRIQLIDRWGGGKSVSADGRLIRMTEKNLMASYNIKYRGVGGMLYTHVSDHYIAIYTQFINCGVYEAEYVLDALFSEENKIDLDIEKIHVDTHGQTEVLFAFCHLLGIKLMPRIKNIGDYKLYKSKGKSYKNIDVLLKDNIVDWKLISDNYNEMMRVVASIREGKVKSSLILKKLRTYNSANSLVMAFKELGKVVRTMYVMDYANSIDIRRMVQSGCNKTEAWNLFQKFVYFGKIGKMTTNDEELQCNSTIILELVCNIIVFWNAKMIERILIEMKRDGFKFKITDIDYISPIITEHINKIGTYVFNLDRENPLD